MRVGGARPASSSVAGNVWAARGGTQRLLQRSPLLSQAEIALQLHSLDRAAAHTQQIEGAKGYRIRGPCVHPPRFARACQCSCRRRAELYSWCGAARLASWALASSKPLVLFGLVTRTLMPASLISRSQSPRTLGCMRKAPARRCWASSMTSVSTPATRMLSNMARRMELVGVCAGIEGAPNPSRTRSHSVRSEAVLGAETVKLRRSPSRKLPLREETRTSC